MGVVSAAMGLVSGSEEKGKEAPDRPRKAKPRPQYQNGHPHMVGSCCGYDETP